MDKLAPIEIDPKKFLRQHCTLPTLPEVITRIQDIIHNSNVEIEKVVELISGDPALVAQVLKVVNSGYYGLPREIAVVRFAIAFLGLNEVYRMVLSLSVINTLSIKEKDEINKFWFHSFYTALCTKYLTKKYEPHLSFEELWSASILHDIGKLVYLKYFPDHYKVLTKFSKEQGCLFSEAERQFSLPSSAYLGTLLCDHWRLPGKVRDACESHSLKDFPSLKVDSQLGAFKRMICLGDLMAVLSAEELNNTTKHEIATAIRASLNCTESEFLAIMGDVYELRTDVERFISQFRL